MNGYIYNNIQFRTKSEVTRYVQEILYRYDLKEFLNREDFNFVYDLLEKGHHDPDKKIRCGISGFFVNTNSYGNRGFFIKRFDGTETDFSFVKCIHPKSELQDLKSACRNAIREEIVTFREDFFNKHQDPNGFITCPFTKEKIKITECHVDHAPPNTFNKIFLDWISSQNINPQNIKLKGYNDGEMTKEFVDKEIEKLFISFHKKVMNLRITSPLGNLSGSKLECK